MKHSKVASRNGGQIVVDGLKIHGVKKVFCVPGESFLPILDALGDAHEDIEVVVCRHEASAAHMAQAYGRLTGQPGVCLVTRGPGLTHASIGLHTAAQDSTPLIMLVGQIDSGFTGREAWQEMDIVQMFQTVTKRVTQIDRIDRIPEILSRSFHAAVSGRPGPCIVALPEDLLYGKAEVADLERYQLTRSSPCATDLKVLESMLNSAENPILILGGSNWNEKSLSAIQSFAEKFELPVATGFRRQDLFNNAHRLYCGPLGPGISPKLVKRIENADLILAIGSRLSETSTSAYTLIQAPRPLQKLIHVHPDSQELGRVFQAQLLVQSSLSEFALALSKLKPQFRALWAEQSQIAHSEYEATLVPTLVPGDVNFGKIVHWLNQNLAPDTIITNGAGNYTSWVHRFYQHKQFGTQLAPTSGTMGYGIPAAIAAKITHPEKTVICFAGDGCFMMSEKELATVKQYKLRIVFIVINNNMFGSIRMHQEKKFPGKVFATELENPDFVLLAQAYGLKGFLVTNTEQFENTFELAIQSDTASVIELRTSPQAITPSASLTSIRAHAVMPR
jgi:acetolactate synthase-1/2/3 large subunit